MPYKTFTQGQKVKNQYGKILTVRRQAGCQVFVNEELGWYHPTKIFSIKRNAKKAYIDMIHNKNLDPDLDMSVWIETYNELIKDEECTKHQHRKS